MNAVIVENLAVEEELITLISNHLSKAGGKRMRPILTILSAKMLGDAGEPGSSGEPDDAGEVLGSESSAIKLAAAVEFIHMATLLHDDVVDGSKMRRFLPSANVVWGSRASILVGDFLFSQSFKLIVSTGSIPALRALSSASAVIAEGEVSQLAHLEQKSMVSEAEYLKIIGAKTAELFGASCEVGAIIAGKESSAKTMRDFGICLGKIFQITDDMLDYFSDSAKVGKNVGDDFFEGKVTLPLILLSKKISADDNLSLQKMLQAESRTSEDFLRVKTLMQENDINTEITNYLAELEQTALVLLRSLSIQNQYCKFLENLVEFAINRTY